MNKKADLPFTYEQVKAFIVHCTEDFVGSEEFDVLAAGETRQIAGTAFGLLCEVLDRATSVEGKQQVAQALADLLVSYADAPDELLEDTLSALDELNSPGGSA